MEPISSPPSTPLLRDDDFQNLIARNHKLDRDILDLKKNYEKVVNDCTKAYKFSKI